MKDDGWKTDRIDNYITHISNKNKDLSIKKVVSVTKYNGIVDSLEYFDKTVFSKDLSGYKIIERNQFAYSTIHLNEGSIGYLDICDVAVLSPMYTVFKINEEKLNRDFLYDSLKSHKYLNIYNQIGEGSIDRRASISFSKFKEIEISVPPLKEQKKIAEILSTVNSQIDDMDILIKKTKELMKGLMQRLLTKGIGRKELKQTELGEIPLEWQVIKIEDICDIVDYRGKTPNKVESGIFLVTAKNIGKGFINYQSSSEFIKEEDYDSTMSRGIPKVGDVLFTTEAPLGNVANVDRENIALAQRVIKFRGNKEIVNNYYLKYYMLGETFQGNILNEATGSTVLGIKGSRLKKILLAIPSLEEQKQISNILSSVDIQIEKHEDKKTKLGKLKKGLMQQLLTGKVRVFKI